MEPWASQLGSGWLWGARGAEGLGLGFWGGCSLDGIGSPQEPLQQLNHLQTAPRCSSLD